MTDPEKTGHPHRAGVLVFVAVTALALVIPLFPGVSETLQWQRSNPPLLHSFQWLTGHLTHWSWDHLIWDLAAFAALSFTALRLIPERYFGCILLAAALIPFEIAINQSQLHSYRGLSGIDSALFGLILTGLWRSNPAQSRIPLPRILAIFGGLVFFAKCLYELGSGQTFFVSASESKFVPAVSAHLVGAICGIASGLVQFRGCRRWSKQSSHDLL